MKVLVQVNDREELVELARFRAAASNKPALLKIFGVLMQASIARTFREEGSPAGSWPKLAASTLLKKGYTTGHKLLVLSGRLFRSITYVVQGDTLIIGTGLVYAPVHQFGSSDYMGGAQGPRSQDQMSSVAEHTSHATVYSKYKLVPVVDRHGVSRRVPQPMRYAKGEKRTVAFQVASHFRRQNIAPRPYVVIRPEDPARLASGAEAFLLGKRMAATT